MFLIVRGVWFVFCNELLPSSGRLTVLWVLLRWVIPAVVRLIGSCYCCRLPCNSCIGSSVRGFIGVTVSFEPSIFKGTVNRFSSGWSLLDRTLLSEPLSEPGRKGRVGEARDSLGSGLFSGSFRVHNGGRRPWPRLRTFHFHLFGRPIL